MVPPEEKDTAAQADGEVSPAGGGESEKPATTDPSPAPAADSSLAAGPEGHIGAAGYRYYDDPYADPEGTGYPLAYASSQSTSPDTALAAATAPPPEEKPFGTSGAPPASGGGGGDFGGEDEEGMVRMSFFEHLAELRRRILYGLAGLVIAFALSLTFAKALWEVVSRPAVDALTQLKIDPPVLAQIAPMEVFNIIWIKLPLLTAVFIASPWLLYQLWAFIAPGLYKKERRWAAPFVISTAGLFLLGGVFAYFVAFRFALNFLLGLGLESHIRPFVSVEEYFSIFVNVMLGIGVVFELPVLIFFLTLIRVVTPGFLMGHVRYAILIIHIIAAIVTPTPDVFNMELFALPMCVLFFVGVGASYILVLRREKRKFPWATVLPYILGVLAVIALAMYFLHARYGYHFVTRIPWFVR